jgi:4-amino-4-deoxy-L-arabinose transferase-like glycosyltransferase
MFPSIPQNICFDEIEFTKLALSLDKKLIIFSKYATGHATPYFYLILTSFKVFGTNLFALRLPAAIFAVLNSLLAFLILEQYFKKQTAFLGAFVFSTLRWAFGFGRFSFEATYLFFWELLCVYTIFIFVKKKNKFFLVLSIVATILTFYSYLPGRIFFLVPLVYLLFNKEYKSAVVFLIFMIVAALPLIYSSKIESRVDSLTFITDSALALGNKFHYFFENLWKTLLMFSFKGDLNGRHNYPGKSALNPLLSILMLIGLFLVSKKKFKNTFLILFWMVISIFPALLTYPQENPHFLRTYTSIFAVIFFISTSINAFILKNKKRLYLWIFTLMILASSIYELRTYFYYQTKVFKNAFEYKTVDIESLNYQEFSTIPKK